MVHPGTGHRALATRTAAGTLSLAGIRLLVLAVGRADVLNREMAVEGALRQVREQASWSGGYHVDLYATPLASGHPIGGEEVVSHFCHAEGTMLI